MENEQIEKFQDVLLKKRAKLQELAGSSKLLGDYYEHLIRDTISKFVNENLKVGHGILRSKEKGSQELDVIVYDTRYCKPLFQENEFLIVPPYGVKAVVQVKSEITTDTLEQSVRNARSVKALDSNIRFLLIGFATDLAPKLPADLDGIFTLSHRDGRKRNGQLKAFLKK